MVIKLLKMREYNIQEQNVFIEILDLLKDNFYKPDLLGNFADPTRELIYLILSQRTRISKVQSIIDNINIDCIENNRELIYSTGRGHVKYNTLNVLFSELKNRYGRRELPAFSGYSSPDLFNELISLPGIGYKVASCLMIYSYNREGYFPVDSNIMRILKRIGLIEQSLSDHHQIQKTLIHAIPPNLEKEIHVSLVILGIEVCKPVKPACNECPLDMMCKYGGKFEYS